MHLKWNSAEAPLRECAPSPPVEPRGWYIPCKHAIDLLMAVLLLVCASPLILFIALLVKLSCGGPVFYCQVRLGKHGREFWIYKIRTMVQSSETDTGAVWSGERDPRITRIGRILRMTHLDELPQLFNVVRGEMSLIGPRPERPEFVPDLERQVPRYRERLLVRPGMTGLAQVHLLSDRNIESVRRKLRFDLYYVYRLGPWLELRVVLATVFYLLAVLADSLGKLMTLRELRAIDANGSGRGRRDVVELSRREPGDADEEDEYCQPEDQS
jgi:lipopolysaccharide/colanic/teichoic acid biosynthesis glycosyltransferase